MNKIVCLFLCVIILGGCSTSIGLDQTEILSPQDLPTSVVPESVPPDIPNPPMKQQPLKLTFAGDIMAHDVNYLMKDYNLIYEDITHILYADDLSFANFEIPVCDELPYETYPTFNVQSPYAFAAIDAGFEVFSLANNHTNDQGLQGIESTVEFFDSLRKKHVYSAGIKRDSGISYDVIETQGWTILFAAVTEIVNSNNNIDKFDVYKFTESGKAALKKDIIALQEQQPHDLFILSVHVNDPEYERTISDARRAWFYELLDAGVDIVWGNHPHITKEWELIQNEDSGEIDKLVIYSIGNTISGQNYHYNYEDPSHRWEYTGTSVLLQVEITKNSILPITTGNALTNPLITSMEVDHTIIATNREANNDVIIKRLTNDFISSQSKKNADYYTERLKLMQEINGITVCR